MKEDNQPSQERMDAWIQDPANYKWGLFYYNPEDERIFPPKRIKAFGWTINFANRLSIVAFLAIIGVIYLLAQLF